MSRYIFDIFEDDMSLSDILNISFNELLNQNSNTTISETHVREFEIHQNVVSRMIDVRQQMERLLEQRNELQSPLSSLPLLSSQFFNIFSNDNDDESDFLNDVPIIVKSKDFEKFEHSHVESDNLELYKNMECNVCLSSYSIDDNTTRLSCGHLFHCECIRKWLCDVSSKCPICRSDCRPDETQV